jgi:hypothetical protein
MTLADDLDADEPNDTFSGRPTQPKWLRYEDYGPERWPITVLDTFVEVKNPRPPEMPVRADIAIGVDPFIHVQLERLRPDRMSDELMAKLLERHRPIRREYLRVILTIPGGATMKIPMSWLRALRKVDPDSGLVTGGLAPFIEVAGEANPPRLASALLGDERPPVPTRRRTERSAP